MCLKSVECAEDKVGCVQCRSETPEHTLRCAEYTLECDVPACENTRSQIRSSTNAVGFIESPDPTVGQSVATQVGCYG